MNQAHVTFHSSEPALLSDDTFRILSLASINCLDLSLCRFSDEDWLSSLLLRQEINPVIQVDSVAASKAIHLYTQQRNQLRKNGQAPLGIGYPFVQWGSITTPLLIWQITLDLSQDAGEAWIINHREPFQRCFINPFIAQKLQEESGFSWDQNELNTPINPQKIIADLVRLTGQDWSSTALDLVAIPDHGQQIAEDEALTLLPAAALGFFYPAPTPQASFSTDALIAPQFIEKKGHSFTLKELDPWQATAWKNISNATINVVNGPAGAGKRHLTQALISNALSIGEKCLVIDAHFATAQAFVKRLEMDGLQRLVYFQREPRTEEAALWKLLVAEQKTTKDQNRFSNPAFEQLLQKLNRLDAQLSKSYQVLRSTVISQHNWTEAVG